MFVFCSIPMILRAQTRKFGEKVGKNSVKNDQKVQEKYGFVRKKYRK